MDSGTADRGVAPGERRSSAMRAFETYEALPRQPFRQEDRALARAELGVVREHHVLHAVERGLVAHAADRDRHAVARISVPAWLRTEGIGVDLQQPFGRRGQTLESVGAEPLYRGGGRRRVGGPLGPDVDGFQVTVLDVDAGARTRDGKLGRLAPVPEATLRLALDLLFLARDEGDDVVNHIERQHPALPAGTRDGLERRHHHGADAEGILERLQRDGPPGGRAVGDRRDEAAPAAVAALIVQRFGMRVVDSGYQNWDIGVIAKRRSGADDGHPFGKARLPDLRDVFGDRAEDQVELLREELLIVEAGEGQ